MVSIGLSSGLLALWTLSHPDVLGNLLRPQVADVAQVYALGSVLAAQGLNYFVVGPLTSKCVHVQVAIRYALTKSFNRTMFQRQKLEKEEGKAYNEAGVCCFLSVWISIFITDFAVQVSAEMKKLNSKFGQLHGISSLANLSAVIALGFHGLWIGNAGVKGY